MAEKSTCVPLITQSAGEMYKGQITMCKWRKFPAPPWAQLASKLSFVHIGCRFFRQSRNQASGAVSGQSCRG